MLYKVKKTCTKFQIFNDTIKLFIVMNFVMEALKIFIRKIDEKKMNNIAYNIAKNLFEGAKVLLYGDLGSGKTTFVKSMTKFFSKDIRVTSPTFAVVKVYDTIPKIHHADLYRIADPYEIEYIDLFHDENAIYFIEWAEYLEYLTPKERLEIRIKYNKDIRYRDVEINGFGQKYENILNKI
ncbi:tRNA (adenosine(37)-N6)-threonylcarbamoyltransferase complex ATPase subunit type 1 TsaE [Tepiditoga spiralis]|uniref:tRNA (adenosine(37)-N6)-threonylcarbamoyltransferase complex ATPase subunit type 1 TsaE n=1 Tax=Tepiditoga spiralis TaxID=2108365 RepID=UPI0016894EE8|nr:tRNA (adenosine(37)-N6)-threonylcarbamoyltransferase complex ATPase subunit type 1 TsaE [Tepiditoga spiralis]